MASESLRVEQVDANILDVEYRQLMERQLELIITELPVTASRICERLKPEIQLLIDGILWTSRAYRGASPGQIEMAIAYKGYTRGKVLLHFFLSVFLSYITKRVASILGHTSAQRILLKTAALMEVGHILHYLNFLRVGGYSTLSESCLSLRNWNGKEQTIGTINYESQNRELLWHTFRDALLLLWPAVAAVSAKWKTHSGGGAMPEGGVALACGRCGRVAVVPMRAQGCGHIACYWCVTSRTPTESARCATCGQETAHITPLGRSALM